MTEEEINDIDLAERICYILARKSKLTPLDAANETGLTLSRVNEIIEENKLMYRAAWLRFDKEMDSIAQARKKLKKRKLAAEYELEQNLKNIQNKSA